MRICISCMLHAMICETSRADALRWLCRPERGKPTTRVEMTVLATWQRDHPRKGACVSRFGRTPLSST